MAATGSDDEDAGPNGEGATTEATTDELDPGGEGEFLLNGRRVDLSLLKCECSDPEGCVLPSRCHAVERGDGGPGKK